MPRPLPQPVRLYRVGGSVRDELLGRPIVDRDFVVVGATPEIMMASGFRPVGRDFPVFLHPDTYEEYALARTERKAGAGYHGFTFFASPEVTLEDDLARRDLTINAMARGEDGVLVDPYGGARDLAAGVLRHVSSAFAEDPLRVLRVARFAARFDFVVAAETEALLRDIVASGELSTLAAERLWQEIARGLMEPRPSRMFSVLRACGALGILIPEVDALFGVPQPPAHHPEIDTGVHVMMALDYAASHQMALAARYAILVHDLGKATSQVADWPKHHGHARASLRIADRVSTRLKVPVDCRDAGRLAARWHGVVGRAAELRPAMLLNLLLAADALRRPARLAVLLSAGEADACSRAGVPAGYPPGAIVREALRVVVGVDAGAIARDATRRGRGTDFVAREIRAARLAALRTWKRRRKVEA